MINGKEEKKEIQKIHFYLLISLRVSSFIEITHTFTNLLPLLYKDNDSCRTFPSRYKQTFQMCG